jgi:DNA recombination protein RmuC
VLYLATEGLYAEIASSKSGIAEKLQAQNVMVAGPSTITALLNSFAMGFKAIAINEKADEVRKVLGAAKSQYETFGTVLEKAKKKIDEAGKTLDEAKHRNDMIQKKLRTVEEIDSGESNMVLELPDYIEE